MVVERTKPARLVRVGAVEIANNRSLTVIAGRCRLESRGPCLSYA